MIESVQDRIKRMDAERSDRFARAQRYEEAMHTDSPTLPIIAPISAKTALEVNAKHRVESKSFDKKSYMKKYMRSRRAAKKAGAR